VETVGIEPTGSSSQKAPEHQAGRTRSGFTAAVDDMPRTAVISLMLLRSGVLVGDDGPELLTDQARKCEGVEARIAFAKFIGLALDEAGVAA
jgi:hypothetical protein